MKNFINIIKKFLPISLKVFMRQILLIKPALTPICKRKCNICNYEGYFVGCGRPLRLDAHCPNCNSKERHRLMMLAFDREEIKQFSNLNAFILHFAAEPIIEKIFRKRFPNYKTADLCEKADIRLNIESINSDENKFDIVIANHVLEHVDEKKAISELYRVLKPGGILICQVPIIEGWSKTFENNLITSDNDRNIYFGQSDHVRFYGADFRERISYRGLKLINEITSEGLDVIKYGLQRGEKVFVFQKKTS